MPLKDIGDIEVVRRNRGSMIMSNDVTEGPMRWKRAMDWAQAHPDSQAAKLFKRRTETAAELARTYTTDRVFRLGSGEPLGKRRRYMCSVECAALQLQLATHDLRGRHELYRLFLESADQPVSPTPRTVFEQLDPHTLEGSVKCRVCGLAIRGDRAVVKAIAQKTEDVTTYVMVAGRFVPVAELRVVDLTADQHALLSEYAEAEGRQRYVDDHGRRLDA